MDKKECVINPKTGRAVKTSGKLGQLIMKQMAGGVIAGAIKRKMTPQSQPKKVNNLAVSTFVNVTPKKAQEIKAINVIKARIKRLSAPVAISSKKPSENNKMIRDKRVATGADMLKAYQKKKAIETIGAMVKRKTTPPKKTPTTLTLIPKTPRQERPDRIGNDPRGGSLIRMRKNIPNFETPKTRTFKVNYTEFNEKYNIEKLQEIKARYDLDTKVGQDYFYAEASFFKTNAEAEINKLKTQYSNLTPFEAKNVRSEILNSILNDELLNSFEEFYESVIEPIRKARFGRSGPL